MPHGINIHDPASVVNRVDHAILANPDSPQILGTLELLASRGSRILAQKLDAAENAGTQWLAQSFQFLPGASGESDVVQHRYRLRLS